MAAVSGDEGDGEIDKEVISMLLTAGAAVDIQDSVRTIHIDKHSIACASSFQPTRGIFLSLLFFFCSMSSILPFQYIFIFSVCLSFISPNVFYMCSFQIFVSF